MNALLFILLLVIIDVDVAAASRRIHLRGRIDKSDKKTESSQDHQGQDRAANATEEETMCQDVDIDIIGTKWNLTSFAWDSSLDGGEETLQPVDLKRERRGMTLLIEQSGTSGTCGNNVCWGVTEKIAEKMFWIHDLARTRMMSTPQEEAYAAMLTRSPYTYTTCVGSSTNHTQLHLFEVDIDSNGTLVQGRLMAKYDQIGLLLL